MRSLSLVCTASLAFSPTVSLAQESPEEAFRDLLCEQCPYDAPVRIAPRNAIAPGLQDLDVISVIDMIEELPSNSVRALPDAAEDSPFYLGASIANMRGMNPAFGTRTLQSLNRQGASDSENTESETDAAGDAAGEDSSDAEAADPDAIPNDAESQP